jgi:sulfate permease, SulP family
MPDGSSSAHLYRPKLYTTIREGYRLVDLRRDTLAGLTVAVVALPLSMAIAVASGVTPERGLFSAIVGGFLISALGGSRYQIGGPAGAFIVLVAATVAEFGLDGLLLTVAVSGLLLIIIGISGLGSMIRHVPHPVTVGFTDGIAITIFASELRELFGLTLQGPEPGPFIPKLIALGTALPTLSWATLVVGVGTSALIFTLRRLRPGWPAMLIAIVFASLTVAMFGLHVETIGSRFGEIPHELPAPRMPALSLELLLRIIPAAISFTLLGGIESLLSAKVADGMTGRKHRSNMELVAQGIANIASAMFGGICVTGTIARTATNVRAGARSPVAGIMHAAYLLAFMLVAAPLARYVPLAALAGVLVVVCWSMVEKEELFRLVRDWSSASVLLTTLTLTVAKDLTFGIIGGCAVAALLIKLGNRLESGDA